MKNKYKTIKELKIRVRFPLFIKGFIDSGGIIRYKLSNLEKNNYWTKEFNSKKELLEYFNK